MRARFWLLVPLLAASVCACAAPPKPCDLMTQEAAATLFGGTVHEGRQVGKSCIFSHSIDTDVNVNLILIPGSAPGTMAQVFPGTLHKDYKTDVVESVPGLGEQNRIVTSRRKMTLQVLYNETILQLSVHGSTNPDLKAAMIETAKHVLGKL